jgi:hypothetical protein
MSAHLHVISSISDFVVAHVMLALSLPADKAFPDVHRLLIKIKVLVHERCRVALWYYFVMKLKRNSFASRGSLPMDRKR